ncbi:hypothetical protein C0991_009824 [Blastosporella zonata]|nr:hypothetical protein C0991_009824 [Blastosporella zonata]
MALGCAFIFLMILLCWRRRARQQRTKRTALFASVKRLDHKLTWRGRIVERLFGRSPKRVVLPTHTTWQNDEMKLRALRDAEDARNSADLDQFINAYDYSKEDSRYSKASSLPPLDDYRPPFKTRRQPPPPSVSSRMSAHSLYSEVTGQPRHMPEPRQPIRKDLLSSRMSSSTMNTSFSIRAREPESEAEAFPSTTSLRLLQSRLADHLSGVWAFLVMLVDRGSNSWAYSEDIPGSRCGPEDGPWPRSYKVLTEPDLWRELRVLAKPQTTVFDSHKGWRADSINFQPSPTTKTQDRYVVTQLNILGSMWTLTGVFDGAGAQLFVSQALLLTPTIVGHLGDVTVEHVAYHLPIIIRDFLCKALANDPSACSSPAHVADLFSQSILAFDDAIANDVLELFGGLEGLENFSDAEIRNIINDQHAGGANWKKARLCMYGTTALVALVDPEHDNLWVANLGDCQATLVSLNDAGDDWSIQRLTTEHNGDNDAEVERVQRAHPGEPECVIDRRPPIFTRRILYNLFPGFHNISPWEEFLVRNRTPPYITAQPEVTHRRLDGPAQGPRFLILSSDGFADLCSGEGQQRIVGSWAQTTTDQPFEARAASNEPSDNMALRLLRRALGGDDRYRVSSVLTLDMDVAWIDDTTIVVQTL